jgi:hypothetical protein
MVASGKRHRAERRPLTIASRVFAQYRRIWATCFAPTILDQRICGPLEFACFPALFELSCHLL